MGNVQNDKIVGVSDNDVVIPVAWGIPATEKYWHNAVIMGTVIARKIDKANLWDGTLNIRQPVSTFRVNEISAGTRTIIDTLSVGQPYMHDINISQSVNYFSAEEVSASRLEINETFPIDALSVGNLSDTEILVNFYNPINSDDLLSNLNAFEITAIFGNTLCTITPTNIELYGTSTLKLTCSTFEQAIGNINVLYKSELGNMYSCMNNNQIDSFNLSFVYVTTYSEGE